jgi:L-ascorbate metabolism protein UlaG (beta-lactamase superfamily)
MNLPYTMDIFQAADAVLEFKPRVVYPYHYRGKPEISNVNAFKELVTEKNSEINVRLLDWYPKS